MSRSAILSLAFCLMLASVASAQDWARKMFNVTSHDFGTVARGADAIYEFDLQNIYEEDVHVTAVRSSCGCTTPSIKSNDLKTWEKGAIVCKFNTDSFLGEKSATVTVTIDKPYYAEVQLNVRGHIRGDVVFQPGAVKLGSVDQGEPASAKVNVAYAGGSNWQILDVRSDNPHLSVEMSEPKRAAGRIAYDLTVKLKDDAPVGYIQDHLTLVTNDGRNPNITLPVEGKIAPAVTVSPAALALGELSQGESVEKKLIVRAKKPFKITSIKCDNKLFQFAQPSDEAKLLHFIPITYTAGGKSGNQMQKIVIETDIAGGASGETVATVNVKDAEVTVNE
ncbi:DUF1573 domain-containing protein [Blastopirellula sp. J2-11]|uniref:DUF1573 domain-containing protein n=1 Tax=Blastopirellula sp. J2-11 TaxID=2943192 RepID=UPI0021C6C90E|nr:DUF1573 domain-containing protein [Blastopirellula sp. J2-11]UUO05510.1 DUF1573 domain-containing protein [Blastopirellula sp. J2-11]